MLLNPDPDGDLKETVRIKIRNYRNIYLNRAFLPLAVDTSGRLYDDFIRLLFFHAHREASQYSDSVMNFPEESDQFRFLLSSCLVNLKGSVGLILAKTSAVRISIVVPKGTARAVHVQCDIPTFPPFSLPPFLPSLTRKVFLLIIVKFFSLGSRLFLFCCN